MSCLEMLLKEALENLPAFLDTITLNVLVDKEDYQIIASVSRDSLLTIEGVVDKKEGKFLPAVHLSEASLKELEIEVLTELKLIIEEEKKK